MAANSPEHPAGDFTSYGIRTARGHCAIRVLAERRALRGGPARVRDQHEVIGQVQR